MDFNFFFGFAGRINRAKYWRVILLNFVCLMIFMMVVPLSIGSSFYKADPKWAMPLTLALLAGTMGPILIISTWCFAAMSIKRLHDRNKSGWWILLFWFGPSILGSWPTAAPDLGGGLVLALAAAAIAIWAFVELGCLPGTPGPNQYGADPLGNPALAPRR